MRDVISKCTYIFFNCLYDIFMFEKSWKLMECNLQRTFCFAVSDFKGKFTLINSRVSKIFFILIFTSYKVVKSDLHFIFSRRCCLLYFPSCTKTAYRLLNFNAVYPLVLNIHKHFVRLRNRVQGCTAFRMRFGDEAAAVVIITIVVDFRGRPRPSDVPSDLRRRLTAEGLRVQLFEINFSNRGSPG